jgi:hypothetical protein
MIRINQGSVMETVGEASNLDQPCPTSPEKVGRMETAKIGRFGKFVQPPNLSRARARTCAQVRPRMRTRVYIPAYRFDKVWRLDRASVDAGFRRPTFRPTLVRLENE